LPRPLPVGEICEIYRDLVASVFLGRDTMRFVAKAIRPEGRYIAGVPSPFKRERGYDDNQKDVIPAFTEIIRILNADGWEMTSTDTGSENKTFRRRVK
jgi:hypothetical protein